MRAHFSSTSKHIIPNIADAKKNNNKNPIDKLLNYENEKIESSVQIFSPKPKPVDFKPEQAAAVTMHEYAVTHATSSQPILGSFGAGPCMILALYDSQNKMVALAHIDTLTSLDSLAAMLHPLSKEHTVAHLAGGNDHPESILMYSGIIQFLQKNDIPIVGVDIMRCSLMSASLAIDSRTGQIYSPVKPEQLNMTPDFEKRLCRDLPPGISPLIEFKITQLPGPAAAMNGPCKNHRQIFSKILIEPIDTSDIPLQKTQSGPQ